NLHNDVDTCALLHLDHHRFASEAFETLLLRFHTILARNDCYKRVQAVSAGRLCAFFRRTQIGQYHLGVDYYGSRGVRDDPGYRSICALRLHEGEREEGQG